MKPSDAIKQLLPQLTSRELREVELLASHFRKGNKKEDIEANTLVFYSTIVEYLAYKTKVQFPPIALFRALQPNLGDKIFEVAEFVENWTNSYFKEVIQLERRRVYGICTELVGNYVEDSTVPLGMKSLLNAFNKLPGIVENNFPGYAASGLLSSILEHPKQPKEVEKMLSMQDKSQP